MRCKLDLYTHSSLNRHHVRQSLPFSNVVLEPGPAQAVQLRMERV